MKQRKAIKFGDREIEIKELTIKEILFPMAKIGLIPMKPEYDLSEKYKDKSIYETILSLTSDITMEEVIGFSPSELKKIYDVFAEVNKTTFDVAKYMGLEKAFEGTKDQIVEGLIRECALSFSGALSNSAKVPDVPDVPGLDSEVEKDIINEGDISTSNKK